MEEKKEKKTIKCSYALLVIILFATVAFLTDYIIIDRKTRKCDCPKCEVTNNEVISDNTKVTETSEGLWKNNGFNCSTETENYCLISNTQNKIELKILDDKNDISEIIINDNQYKLDISDSIGEIVETEEGNVLCKYYHNSTSQFILLDSNADFITDFTDLYEPNSKGAVRYVNGIFETMSSYKSSGIGYNIMMCDIIDENDILYVNKTYKYLGNNSFELIERKEISLREAIENEKEISGYSNCEEFRNK